jgi:hypothetical protein
MVADPALVLYQIAHQIRRITDNISYVLSPAQVSSRRGRSREAAAAVSHLPVDRYACIK